ncbi:GatB/YqeY domain-containing protein [Nocardia sp. 2]|uniref:GatB/YqeY domain-containing protein n=1 Tax=Nocardia acididurans TaxID=2802282 RepID=A0ABS1MEK0_9NOCA|nr:GatB/YqeY domain-containing protein [Nocardia acididurans]MBL1079078.1 GatB/YqeY domain-containing protein [Nocardia acididurans]
MTIEPIAESYRTRLRADLKQAMKDKNRPAIAALRSLLAAIDNHEAVDASHVQAGAIETSPLGLGAAELPRRELTAAEIDAIIKSEYHERITAAAEYDTLTGGADRAATLRAEAAALAKYADAE